MFFMGNMVNGYIVKLYRNLPNQAAQLKIEHFDFLALMNFSGIRIIPVNKFFQYSTESLNGDTEQNCGQNSINYSCERQKLLLYSAKIAQPKDELKCDRIFDTVLEGNGLDDVCDFPMLVLTSVFLKDTKDTIEKQINKIDEEVCKFCAKYNARYNIFRTLGSDGIVVALRCCAPKTALYFAGNTHELENVISTYSVAGIKLQEGNWVVDKNDALDISLRITLKDGVSIKTFKRVFDEFQAQKAIFLAQPKIHEESQNITIGKYDIIIEGELQSFSRLVDFYKEYLFNEQSELGQILQITSTRFKKELNGFLSETPTREEKVIPQNHFTCFSTQSLINDLSNNRKNKHLSPTIKSSLIRLVLRANQYILSVPNAQRAAVYNAVSFFVKSCLEKPKTTNVTFGISCFNTYFDNRENDIPIGFENPKGNYRFIGAARRLLESYSNILATIFSALYDKQGIYNYIPLVVADMVGDVSATPIVMGEDNETRRLVGFVIPIEMLFNTEIVLPCLLHEAGHFFKCKEWDFPSRNYAFLSGVYDSCNAILNLAFKQDSILERVITQRIRPFMESPNNLCCIQCCEFYKDKCQNIKLDTPWEARCKIRHLRCLSFMSEKYVEMVIYNAFASLNSQIAEETLSDFLQINQELHLLAYNSFREAIADILMTELLGINKIENYCKIFADYFAFCNDPIQPSKLGDHLSVLIRMSAVGALLITVFEKADLFEKKTQEEFIEEYLKVISSRYENNSGMKYLYKFLDSEESVKYGQLIIELYVFLYKKFYQSISCAMQQWEQLERLKKDLSSLFGLVASKKSGKAIFEAQTEFIDMYAIR